MLFIICWSVVIALLPAVVFCKEESLYVPGPVDCAKFKVGKQLIDLSRVNKEWSVTFEKSDYTLRFNPCAPLKGHQTSCPRGSKMCLFEGGSSDSGTAVAGFGDHVAYAVVHKSVPQIVLVIGQSSLSSDRFPFVGLVRITCPEDDGDSDEEYTRRRRHGNKKNTPYLSEEHSPFYQVSIMDKSVCRLYEDEGKIFLSEYAWITAKYLLIIVLLYFSLGTLYRALVLGKRGIEMIPNHHIWKEGFLFIRDFFTSLIDRLSRRRRGYQSI